MGISEDTIRNVIFLDTNVFLQCRDIKDLPWQEICEDAELLLLIPRTVQEEIDRQKCEGNTRRGKRARKTAAFFREIILDPNSSVVIKKGCPTVLVEFAATPPSENKPDFLDLTHPDDRIVYEVWHYKTEHPQSKIGLLTHDTSPMLTCKKLNLPFYILPDSWLLLPEPDPRDKKMHDLEQQIKELAKIQPQIELSVSNNAGINVPSAEISITKYRELTNDQVAELLKEASSRSPEKTSFDEVEPPLPASLSFSRMSSLVVGYEWVYQKVSETEVEDYHAEYEAWLVKLNKFYNNLSKSWGYNQRYHEVQFHLANTGTTPAEHLVIEFETVGEFLLSSPKSIEAELKGLKIEAPLPPDPPEGKWIQRRRGLGLFDNHYANGRVSPFNNLVQPLHDFGKFIRDRNAFYYKKGKGEGFTTVISFECEEFRHKLDPETFEFIVLIPPDVGLISGGVSCIITAKNLPSPVKQFYPVTVTSIEGNIHDVAVSLLPKTLPEIFFKRK